MLSTTALAALVAASGPYASVHGGFARSDENNLIFADTAAASVAIGWAPDARWAGLGLELDVSATEANVESYNWPGDDVEGDARSTTATLNLVAYTPEIGHLRAYAAIGAGAMWTQYDVPGVVELGAVPFQMTGEHVGPAYRIALGTTAALTARLGFETSAQLVSGFDREIELQAGPLPANPGIYRAWGLRFGLRYGF